MPTERLEPLSGAAETLIEKLTSDHTDTSSQPGRRQMASKDTDHSSALIPKLFVYHFNSFVIWATKNVHKPAFEKPARV